MGANYLTNQREILANAFLLGNQKSQLKAQKSWPQDLNYRDQDVQWVWSLSEVVKTSLLRGKYILYVYMVCGGGMLSLTVTKTHTRSSVNLENYSPVTSKLPWIGFSSCGGSWTQATVMETDATSHLTIFDCDSFCALIADDTVLSYTSASCLMKKEAPVTGEMGKKSFQSRSLAHELSRDQTRNQWYDPRYFWQYLRGWQQLHLTWAQTYHGFTNSDMRPTACSHPAVCLLFGPMNQLLLDIPGSIPNFS